MHFYHKKEMDAYILENSSGLNFHLTLSEILRCFNEIFTPPPPNTYTQMFTNLKEIRSTMC